MKKISTLALSFSFIGSFLGAGYVSGQELYQFFGKFGASSFAGLFAAISILAIFNLIIVKTVNFTGSASIDTTVVGSDRKPLLFAVGVLETAVFFGTYVVMAAGAGALVQRLFGTEASYYIGSFVFCLAVSFLAIKGISGLVRIFSFSVPILVAVTVAVSISAIAIYGKNGFDFSASGTYNPLIPNIAAGAVTFASYNLFCGIGVLCPLGLRAENMKKAVAGTLIGGIFLVLVAFAVFFALAAVPSAKCEELPMMAIAESVYSPLMYVYAVLLLLSTLGASLSCLIPISSYLADKSEVCRKHGAPVIFLLSLFAFLMSCLGFSDLIGTLFSSFGYVSLLGLAGLVRHFIKIKKAEKNIRRNA